MPILAILIILLIAVALGWTVGSVLGFFVSARPRTRDGPRTCGHPSTTRTVSASVERRGLHKICAMREPNSYPTFKCLLIGTVTLLDTYSQ